MPKTPFLSKFINLCVLLLTLGYGSAALAKDINLYEQPQDKAKVVGTVDLTTGIIPIFTPEKGDWMKVGDPRNGNVGWVKSSELNNGGNATFTFTQKIMNDGKGPQTYQVIQYGKPQKISGEQVQSMIQKMQTRQQAVQQDMQNAIQNMVKDMNTLYQQTWGSMGGMPVIMPIVIMPPANSSKPATAEPAKKQ